MINYKMAGDAPTTAPVWSRTFWQPLAPSVLTPFSLSVLTEMAGRSWYSYYDHLSFDPTPRSRVVRGLHGRPYFALSLSAQLETQATGSEPPAMLVNGTVRPLARWEKPSLFAGLKLRGNTGKLAAVLSNLSAELEIAAAKSRGWLARVQEMHWSQAEILQIMEEIERVGAGTMQLYIAARLPLEFARLRLLSLLPSPSTADHLAALDAALRPEGEMVETTIARRVAELAQIAAREPDAATWLAAGDFADWQDHLSGSAFAEGLRALLGDHGHGCSGGAELMTPRWNEDPSPLLAAIAARQNGAPPPAPAGPDEGPFLALVDAKRRKEAQTLLAQARQALMLQSRGLDVHACTLAGTRLWALAAAHEAMGDGRLLAADDIFFYELEETKEMMTGEWNISDLTGIHVAAAERKAEWQRQQQTTAGDLLIGECEAFAPPWAASFDDGGLPGV